METAYNPTFDKEGNPQPGLHSKHYMHLQDDIHYKKVTLCQDCYTSNDLHGDGFLTGSTMAAVEIECQDCHDTTTKYSWELPMGYGDEYSTEPASGDARGVTKRLPEYLKKGYEYSPRDGYLLSSRGNALNNVVRTGDSTLVHLAGECNNAKTLDLIIYMGFRITTEQRVRLKGVDTPETWRQKKDSEEDKKGMISKNFVVKRLEENNNEMIVRTDKHAGKYGRYIAEVILADSNISLNEELLQKGLAREWK